MAEITDEIATLLKAAGCTAGGPNGDGTYVHASTREVVAAISARPASADTCPKCKRTRIDWDCAEDNCPMAARPASAGVGEEEAKRMVDDLLDAANGYEHYGSRKSYRDDYLKQKSRVIAALTARAGSKPEGDG